VSRAPLTSDLPSQPQQTRAAVPQPRRFNPFRRLRRDEGGFTAVEFALVIGPFLALLFAILEVGLTYFVSFAFEHAVMEASREIRTLKVQGANVNGDEFRERICNNMPRLITCSDVVVDVRSFTFFSDAANNAPKAIDEDGNLMTSAQAQWNPGNPGQVVLVSAYYHWKLLASMPNPGATLGLTGIGFGNMPDGSRLITASLAFKNE
jgi:Flp pilus assembly protein TadG